MIRFLVNLYNSISDKLNESDKICFDKIVILLLFSFIMYSQYRVDSIFLDDKKADQLMHNNGIMQRIDVEDDIMMCLDKIREKSGADRTGIIELHNSGQNLTKLPFLHFTMTYESIDVCNDSVDYISDDYKGQLVSDYSGIYKILKENPVFYCENLNIVKNRCSRLYKKLMREHTKSLLIYVIRDNDDNIIAVIYASSNTEGGIDFKQCISTMSQVADNIKKCLIDRREI